MDVKTSPTNQRKTQIRNQERNLNIHLRLGSWNVRTMCPGFTADPDCNLQRQGATRKTALIDRELAKLAVDVAALQETRLAESGSIKEQNYTFFWMGKAEDEHRTHGVGFAVSNKLVRHPCWCVIKDHLHDAQAICQPNTPHLCLRPHAAERSCG